MSSIFATPKNINNSQEYKILFLHGLEGSTNGTKANYLKEKWSAFVPPMRTEKLVNLKSSSGNVSWEKINKSKISEALTSAFNDAVDAVNYIKPDMIIGSSMGGAILMKLINDSIVESSTPCIFLAPAINQLLDIKKIPKLTNSVWLLAECDEVVPNNFNIKACLQAEGNLMISPGDGHRLSSVTKNGLLDSAIISSIEISNLV